MTRRLGTGKAAMTAREMAIIGRWVLLVEVLIEVIAMVFFFFDNPEAGFACVVAMFGLACLTMPFIVEAFLYRSPPKE